MEQKKSINKSGGKKVASKFNANSQIALVKFWKEKTDAIYIVTTIISTWTSSTHFAALTKAGWATAYSLSTYQNKVSF